MPLAAMVCAGMCAPYCHIDEKFKDFILSRCLDRGHPAQSTNRRVR